MILGPMIVPLRSAGPKTTRGANLNRAADSVQRARARRAGARGGSSAGGLDSVGVDQDHGSVNWQSVRQVAVMAVLAGPTLGACALTTDTIVLGYQPQPWARPLGGADQVMVQVVVQDERR